MATGAVPSSSPPTPVGVDLRHHPQPSSTPPPTSPDPRRRPFKILPCAPDPPAANRADTRVPCTCVYSKHSFSPDKKLLDAHSSAHLQSSDRYLVAADIYSWSLLPSRFALDRFRGGSRVCFAGMSPPRRPQAHNPKIVLDAREELLQPSCG